MFSPALTEGATGDMFYLSSMEDPGLICDIVEGRRVVISAYLKQHYVDLPIFGCGVAETETPFTLLLDTVPSK